MRAVEGAAGCALLFSFCACADSSSVRTQCEYGNPWGPAIRVLLMRHAVRAFPSKRRVEYRLSKSRKSREGACVVQVCALVSCSMLEGFSLFNTFQQSRAQCWSCARGSGVLYAMWCVVRLLVFLQIDTQPHHAWPYLAQLLIC